MDHQHEQLGGQSQLNMNAVQFLEEQMGQCSLQQEQPSTTAFNMISNSDDRAEHQQIAPVLSTEDDELARLIPNPSVRKMYLELELILKSKPRVSKWDGYYHSSNIAEHSRHPFLTHGLAPKPNAAYKIVTSAGSLVLVRAHSIGYSRQQLEPEVPIKPKVPIKPAVKEAGRRRSRPKKPQQRRAAESSNSSSSTAQHGSTSILLECPYCTSWDRLLVYNPQTLEVRERVRELPRPDCSLLLDRMQPPWNYSGYRVDVKDDRMQPPWDYRGYHGGVQSAMVAQTDSYKVILAFETYVIVYSSTADDWSYFQCQRPTPFGWDGAYSDDHGCVVMSSDVPWAWFAASAMINGRLYCADVVQETHAKFVLRLFEVDYEAAATWKLHSSFTLRKRHWDFLPAEPSCSIGREMDSIRFLELVECMGQIYAVIPARIDEYLTTEFTSLRTKEEVLCADVPAGCHILPVQFHILRLHGDRDDEDRDDRFAHRVLRIVVPHVVDPSDDSQDRDDTREDLLPEFKSSKPRWSNWFCCAAEGSVIFVAHEEYLLQYDVVSGVSKTGIIQETMLIPIPHTRYSPNVHMKP